MADAPRPLRFDAPRPVFAERARGLLNQGRRALKSGDREGAVALLAAAGGLDPAVFCEPWGLLPILEDEGRGVLRDRMAARLQSWYRAPRSLAHKHVSTLTRKTNMRPYIEEAGLPLPRLLAQAAALSELDWAALPDRVVIKPENGGSSRGVIVAADGRDHMSQRDFGADLRGHAGAIYEETFDAPVPVLVEELLADVDAPRDPALVIPRDFKVFAVAGHAVYVRVHDRNAPDGRRSLATLGRDGGRLPASLKNWPEAPDMPVPEGFAALIAMAEHLSHRLPWLLRLDFYLTPRGPVFGEFTTYPNAGLGATPFARRTLLQMWEIWPD